VLCSAVVVPDAAWVCRGCAEFSRCCSQHVAAVLSSLMLAAAFKKDNTCSHMSVVEGRLVLSSIHSVQTAVPAAAAHGSVVELEG